MSTLVKAGTKPSNANAPAKSKRAVTPKLICILSGNERFTNKEYLDQKAANCGSQKRFLSHYCASEPLQMYKAAMEKDGEKFDHKATVEHIRKHFKTDAAFPVVTQELMKVALEINGKRAKKKAAAAKTPAKSKTPSKKSSKAPAAKATSPAPVKEEKAEPVATQTPAPAQS